MSGPLFRNRYRVDSIRLPDHDYGQPGLYFVTLCTHQRSHYFGRVEGDRTRLSPIGQIADDCWCAIPHHHPHVSLDAFIVMPDHVHGLIQITVASSVEDEPRESVGNQFGPLPKGSLQAIMQSYKAAVTRTCRRQGLNHFRWQSRYYEHIVRPDGSADRIRRYILDNPRKWTADRSRSANVWM